MSDNEVDTRASEDEASEESEVESITEEDLIEDTKDYTSEVESSDDEKEPKKVPPKKSKKSSNEEDEPDEDEVGELEEDDIDDLELDSIKIEEAKKISQKFSIVIDPRSLEDHVKPNPKIRREIVISRDKYKSSEYLQIYEFCELVGVRAQHISDGADVYVEVEDETTARDIAKKELQLGKCPFLIKRYMTPMAYDPVYVEIWDPNDMAIDPKFFDS